jgi:xylitol oxidase
MWRTERSGGGEARVPVTGRSTNWAGNIAFRAGDVHRPASVREVQSLVSRNGKVRVLGSGHSFNDIADTPDALVSLAGLPPVLEIDTAAGTVRVGASLRYAELGRRLHEKGHALANLASLPHISVAGSIATATHGSGDANGNLATAVSALEMVTAEGDLVSLSRRRDAERFQGAVVGLGALGIVISVTLDITPAFDVRQYVYEGLPFEVLDEHFSDIVSRAYSVSLFTGWRDARIDQVWVKHRVGQAGTRPVEEADWFGARPAGGPRHPVPGMSAVHCTEQLGVPGPWFERLPHFRPDFTPSSGAELQSEYLLPRRHAIDAMHAVNEIRDRVAPVLQISEIRTIAADELWMSPSYRQETVAFHFTWIEDVREVLPVIRVLDERLAAFEARPHWGKLFTTPPEVLQSRYPRLPDFHDLVREYDPAGTFTNDFLDRHLFGD